MNFNQEADIRAKIPEENFSNGNLEHHFYTKLLWANESY
jgi:hypothetical protein